MTVGAPGSTPVAPTRSSGTVDGVAGRAASYMSDINTPAGVAYAPVRVVADEVDVAGTWRFAPVSNVLGGFAARRLPPVWCPFGHLAPRRSCRCGHRVFDRFDDAGEYGTAVGDPSHGWCGHRFVAATVPVCVVDGRCVEADVVDVTCPRRCHCLAPATGVGWCVTGDPLVVDDARFGWSTLTAACRTHRSRSAAACLDLVRAALGR